VEVSLRTVEEVEDSLEGAVIESLRIDDEGGIRILLADGRSLLIPEAEIIAVLPRGDTH
jgi:hypothetical protein